MENIIIIGAGNHHNVLGVIRALGESGYGVELIIIGNIRKNYVTSSRYIKNHHVLSNIKELAAFLLYRSPSFTDKKEILISCSDAVTEHLNLFQDRLSERYILPGVPKQGEMLELMDKTKMMEKAAKLGIMSPMVWLLPKDRAKVEFPCITKVHLSSHGAKSDIVICRNREQFDGFVSEKEDEIFAQSYVDKSEEVQFIGCSLNGGEEIIVPGMSRVLRSQPNTNTGFLEYGPVDPFYSDTVKKAKLFVKACRYSGLFSFEIMRGKDDRIWFLEINFRNDGNAWCVTKAGINLPTIWVKSCLGEDYASEIRVPEKIVMMPEFQDFKLVLQRKLPISLWLNDWKRTDFFMEYDKKDPKPFWRYIIDKIL